MERKEINFDNLKQSIQRRTGDLGIKNIRIIRRFEECGRNYTEFEYDSLKRIPIIGGESLYETNHCVYEDTWCC